MNTLAALASMVTAIVIESAPFLLLGSLLGALVEVLTPEERLRRLMPKHPAAAVALGLVGGFFLPVCECGVVPVARRLMGKGVPPSAAIAFMLAAPVVNPVVLLSTWVAFQGDPSMLFGRVLLVLVPAACVGLALGGVPASAALRPERGNGGAGGTGGTGETRPGTAHGGRDVRHDQHVRHVRQTPGVGAHGGDAGFQTAPGGAGGHVLGGTAPMGQLLPMDHEHGPGCARGCEHVAGEGRLAAILRHTTADFLRMGLYLMAGALASGLFKVLVPGGLLALLNTNLILAVLGMMGLAVLLSICSEADAFVAASFSMLPAPAQLAFVALGPMFDLKLLAMWSGTFHRRIVIVLAVVPAFLVLLLSLLWGFWLRSGGAA